MAEIMTTETLRETLFDALAKVQAGTMTSTEARTIAVLADKILATAELEIKYSLTCSRLDKEDQGVSTGPMLLTGSKQNQKEIV